MLELSHKLNTSWEISTRSKRISRISPHSRALKMEKPTLISSPLMKIFMKVGTISTGMKESMLHIDSTGSMVLWQEHATSMRSSSQEFKRLTMTQVHTLAPLSLFLERLLTVYHLLSIWILLLALLSQCGQDTDPLREEMNLLSQVLISQLTHPCTVLLLMESTAL